MHGRTPVGRPLLRQAVGAALWAAGLFGLGVLGLWWAGWLPWPLAGERSPSTPVQSGPVQTAPVKPAPEQTAPTPPLPEPQPEPEVPSVAALPAAPPAAPRGESARPPPPPTTPSVSLDDLNQLRQLAGLGPLTAEPAWAAGCAAHARYLVGVDRGEHTEDPQHPLSSAEGVACAPGHYFVSSRPDSGADRALGYWATGAFHLPQLLDPRLGRVALGLAHDIQGEVQSAAVLDVRRGLSRPARYPVRFPQAASRSPYRAGAGSEWPDPLPGCPGYDHPVGPPVALLLGPDAEGGGAGVSGSGVSGAALKVNGRPVAACLLTGRSFRGASEADTRVGRSVLAAQGAAIVLPRRPFPAGAQVRVSFRTPAGPVAWSFRVQ